MDRDRYLEIVDPLQRRFTGSPEVRDLVGEALRWMGVDIKHTGLSRATCCIQPPGRDHIGCPLLTMDHNW